MLYSVVVSQNGLTAIFKLQFFGSFKTLSWNVLENGKCEKVSHNGDVGQKKTNN